MMAQMINDRWNKKEGFGFGTVEGIEMEMKKVDMDQIAEKHSGLLYAVTFIAVPAAMLLLLAVSVTAVVAPIAWLAGLL